MKTQPTEFPTEFRNDSDHRALAMVFDALRSSKLAGTAAYYAGIEEDDIPPCVGVWGRGLARWVIVAVDGEHRPVGKDWHRHTEHGWHGEISPMQQAINAADHVQKDIQKRTEFSPFVVRVLVFVDMARSEAIEEVGRRCRVYPVWDVHHLDEDLELIAEQADVHHPPEDYQIRKEVPPTLDFVDRSQLAALLGDVSTGEETARVPWLDTLLKESDFTLVYRAEHVEQHVHIHAPEGWHRPAKGRRRPRGWAFRFVRWLKRRLAF